MSQLKKFKPDNTEVYQVTKIIWRINEVDPTYAQGYLIGMPLGFTEFSLEFKLIVNNEKLEDVVDALGIVHSMPAINFFTLETNFGGYEYLNIEVKFHTTVKKCYSNPSYQYVLKNEMDILQYLLSGLNVNFCGLPLNSNQKLLLFFNHAFYILRKIRMRCLRDPVTYIPLQFGKSKMVPRKVILKIGNEDFSVRFKEAPPPGLVLFTFDDDQQTGVSHIHVDEDVGRLYANRSMISYDAFADLIIDRLESNKLVSKSITPEESLLYASFDSSSKNDLTTRVNKDAVSYNVENLAIDLQISNAFMDN
jgi:hypothetical protein